MLEKVKVSDLTVDELRAIVQETVREVLLEVLDPDRGLEVREELIEELQESAERVKRGEEPLVPAEEVARRLGLEW
ncbi:MAG TPA: hypothetical protein ENJ40_01815 [Thermosulfurimonas dismutans]|uniref:Uncharacterized protein n=1 Tax=Thermosulfurimonas dismutans TaxID=999894 RepID=A0A7C3GJN5_9BACT|nr:hypothetical protein [Thermosulfurimonas dismutans]